MLARRMLDQRNVPGIGMSSTKAKGWAYVERVQGTPKGLQVDDRRQKYGQGKTIAFVWTWRC